LTEGVTVSQARKSTLIVAAIFGFLCGWQWYRGRPLLSEIFGVASVVLLVCAMIPVAAVWFFGRWMALAAILGYVNTRILLSLFFYVIMTPVGLIVRITGHDGMQRRGALRGQASYWHPREHTRQSKEGFERAF
jgi:Saxitoxin biosynthesis operon protein SxtJ